MRKVVLLVLALLVTSRAFGERLFVWQDRLYYQTKDALISVKEGLGENLRGYALVDDEHIFLAYQPGEQAEASTIISIMDLRSKAEKKLDDIGGTGESFFAYNQNNGFVAFNWTDGIYVFKLSGHKPNSYKKVIYCDNCFEVYWVDASTIAFTDLSKEPALKKTVRVFK